MVKKSSIYPMLYISPSDDIIYTQIYIAYAIYAGSICSFVIVKIKCPDIEIIYFTRLILCIG